MKRHMDNVFFSLLRNRLFKAIWRQRSKNGGNAFFVSGRSHVEKDEEIFFDQLFEEVNRLLDFSSNDVVLDLGCADGALFSRIAPHISSAVLVDYSAKMADRVRQRLGDKPITFRQADASAFCEGEALFDKVLCYSVIHYLDSFAAFERMLQNVFQMLKPGGRALIGDIPLTELQVSHDNTWMTRVMSRVYVSYSEKGILEASRRHGFVAEMVGQPANFLFSDIRRDLVLTKPA